MLLDFLLLSCNLQLRLLSFNTFVIPHKTIGNTWLGYPNTDDLNTRSPVLSALGQSFGQLFIQHVKLINEHLL